MENLNIIDKNWKTLTKNSKPEITSNEDKSIAKCTTSRKRFWPNYR